MGIASVGAEVEISAPVSSNVTSSNVSNPVINLNLASERIDNTSTPSTTTSPSNIADQSAELSQSSDLAASVGILGGSGGQASLAKESTGLSDTEGPNDIISKFFDKDNNEVTTPGLILGVVVVFGGGYYLWKKYKKG